MIARMKKLRLTGLCSERDDIFGTLLRLGCVEVDSPAAEDEALFAPRLRREPAASDMLTSSRDRLRRCAEIIRSCAPVKKPLLSPKPSVSAEALMAGDRLNECLDIAGRVLKLDGQARTAKAEMQRLSALKTSLEPWRGMDIPLDMKETANAAVVPCMLPSSASLPEVGQALAEAVPEAAVTEVSSDKLVRYCVLICFKDKLREALDALSDYSVSTAVLPDFPLTAEQSIERCDREMLEQESAQRSAFEAIASHVERMGDIELCIDTLSIKLDEEESKSRSLLSEHAFTFEGWVPEENAGTLSKALSGYAAELRMEDPSEDEYAKVPVKLKNNAFTRCMNAVTDMYAPPAYGGVDPNPLMAPFFIVFYGFMMADMAYGAVMLAAGLAAIKKARPRGTGRNFAELLVWCGISTFAFGAATGGLLGDFIPQLLSIVRPGSSFSMPALFTPLDDTVAILIGSMVLGVVQIFTGMAVNVVWKLRSGDAAGAVFNEFAWWAILLGAALAVSGRGIWLLAAGAVLLVAGCVTSNRGAARFTSIIGTVYNGVTGYFSDILSYARLMALMLAGSVIAQVFNTLGAVTGNAAVFIVISLVGNSLNLALNLLGCYVHDLRLQCLEFFNRFYKEGSRAFRPLDAYTKYVDIADRD